MLNYAKVLSIIDVIALASLWNHVSNIVVSCICLSCRAYLFILVCSTLATSNCIRCTDATSTTASKCLACAPSYTLSDDGTRCIGKTRCVRCYQMAVLANIVNCFNVLFSLCFTLYVYDFSLQRAHYQL